MITKQVIENIYKKYRSRPDSPDKLNLPLLFEHTIENHGIYVDDGNLVIESVEPDSPFHTIPLSRINGIVNFDRQVAVVLPNAIIFLNKADDGVNVHVRMPKMSFMERMRQSLSGHQHPEF